MKNKKIIIPIILIIIGISLWTSGIFNSKSELKEPIVTQKKEEPIVHKIEQKDPHAGHNHAHVPTIKAIIPKGATKIVEGDFTQPLFCNNKESIIYTDAKGNTLFYQKNLSSPPEIILQQTSVGNNVGWSKDCETVFFKEKTKDYKLIIKSININTKEIKTHLNYPPQTELRSIAISDTTYYLDAKTLAVKAVYENQKWDISTQEGNYYKLLISPNNKYIAAHLSANVMLFSTDGTFIKDLGRGIATDWSPDSKRLIGFLDETSDGHDVSGSELYFFNLEGASPTQITSTANAIEMWPVFKSKDEIVYTDEVNKGVFTKKL